MIRAIKRADAEKRARYEAMTAAEKRVEHIKAAALLTGIAAASAAVVGGLVGPAALSTSKAEFTPYVPAENALAPSWVAVARDVPAVPFCCENAAGTVDEPSAPADWIAFSVVVLACVVPLSAALPCPL